MDNIQEHLSYGLLRLPLFFERSLEDISGTFICVTFGLQVYNSIKENKLKR